MKLTGTAMEFERSKKFLSFKVDFRFRAGSVRVSSLDKLGMTN